MKIYFALFTTNNNKFYPSEVGYIDHMMSFGLVKNQILTAMFSTMKFIVHQILESTLQFYGPHILCRSKLLLQLGA